MPPIQQRLQLIRSCLELGETELLALQVEKLSAEALDADLQALVAVLQAGVYRQALPQLVDYLGRSQALVVAVDAEREALMAEWRQLERFWGAVLDKEQQTLEGENVLGRLLMELRQIYQTTPTAPLTLEPLSLAEFYLMSKQIESVQPLYMAHLTPKQQPQQGGLF